MGYTQARELRHGGKHVENVCVVKAKTMTF